MQIEIITILASLFIGFLMGYLASYFKEKGKNRSLIEDLAEMTNEKEKVSSQYQLDISKRKYKYEAKREQYFKYFNLFDEFNTQGNMDAQTKFMPALKKFNTNFLGANGSKKKELKATSDFSNSINDIMFKANESLLRLKQETNTIKLIAGDKVLEILEKLESGFDFSMVKSAKMMNDMSKNVINRKTDILTSQQTELEQIGKYLKDLKNQLIFEVKKELDEI